VKVRNELLSREVRTKPLRATRPLVYFMLTVPFALILNSDKVVVTTQLYPDGTGLRQVSAEADTNIFKKPLDKWTYDVEAGGKWQERWQEDSVTKSTTTITRNFITGRMEQAGDGAAPQIVDVFQKPLSIYTTCTWAEQVTLKYHSNANPAEAKAGGHYLLYHVIMPGRVINAASRALTAGGAAQNGRLSGSHATLILDASASEYTVTVTSRKVRWGYLAIVLYVALFVIYHGGNIVLRRIRSRPKRI